ncbi:MAG: hypothetical protein IKX24_12555 [Prevotella sp.]|nr:hypothetical protein [Prevotella sp.]
MATLILQVPDESLVSKVRQACKMLVGVTSVKVQKEKKTKKRDITKRHATHAPVPANGNAF